MSFPNRRLLVCNCEKSMTMRGATLAQAFGVEDLRVHTQLCRSEIGTYEDALKEGESLCVACTQESPLFSEIAEEAGREAPVYVNIREMAGWSADNADPSPKMAALIAAAAMPAKPARLRTIESDGLCLVAGSGQAALDAAQLLNRTLSVTLLLSDWEDIVLPFVLDFPIFCGRLRSAKGSLGGFDVVVDEYAPMLPSSRSTPQFAMPRDGATSNCSVLFDMSGAPSPFARPDGRDGYFRADPGDPSAVMRAIFEASAYEGEFEKPIYVGYDASICAHERSGKTGCTKCIDNCPHGAISPTGDTVTIDAGICGGCGSCAAHCPTGAVAYQYPPRDETIQRLQIMARTFLDAGGEAPVLLIHDAEHGIPLLSAMSRFGRGLPANVIPFEMHSATSAGHDILAAALTAGFRSITILVDPRKSGELNALNEEIQLIDALLDGLELESGRIRLVLENDPDGLENVLYAGRTPAEIARSTFTPVGSKRDVARAAITLLARAGTPRGEVIALPQSAPYGEIKIDTTTCTLCLACVSACPADALRDNPDKPQLRFVEAACVQCGICAATCPEDAIALTPRYNLAPDVMQPVTLHEDEPAECVRCGKPFAARGVLDRVKRDLGGKHWMFQSEERVALIEMCDACRLETLSEGGRDPFAIASRPRMRTTDDYIQAEKRGLSIEDFLSED